MERGRAFELRVKAAIENAMAAGELGVVAQHVKVFHRKDYPSLHHGSPIITDVSVELYWRGAEEPWLIWIWECKDSGRQVDVSEVEEFHAKLEQIGADGTKGTVATRHGFQRSAINYAQAMKIGLVRVLPEGSLIRLLEVRRQPTAEDVREGLSDPETRNLESNYYALTSARQPALSMRDTLVQELVQLLKDRQAAEQDRRLPKFRVEQSGRGESLTLTETSIMPSWSILQLSGDPVDIVECRYRSPTGSTAWRQISSDHFERTKLTGTVDMTRPVVFDDRVAEDEIAIEIRFAWNDQERHDLHKWKVEQSSGLPHHWNVVRKVLKVNRWAE